MFHPTDEKTLRAKASSAPTRDLGILYILSMKMIAYFIICNIFTVECDINDYKFIKIINIYSKK